MEKLSPSAWRHTQNNNLREKWEVITGEKNRLEPKVEVRRRGVSASFKFLDDDEGTFALKEEEGKIKLIKSSKEVHLYDLGYRRYCERNQLHPVEEWSFEQEVILKKRPPNNILTFSVEIRGLKCERRGSGYAFYREVELPHLALRNRKKVLKEDILYLNPVIAKDRLGQATKAEVELKNGTLTIKIDKAFLENAAYPISIDPSYTIKTGASEYSTAYTPQRNLARTSDGTLWCVYSRSDGTYEQIYISYSPDGETWTEEQVSSGSGHQYYPSVAVDSQDNVHVVWTGKGWGSNPNYNNIQYRKRTSSGWQAQEAVTDKDSTQYNPAIAIDSQGNVHVVWYGGGWGSNPNYYNIQYRKRTSAGWQAQEALTDKDDKQYDPAIAIDSQDNVHIVWEGGGWGSNPDYYNIQYRKRTSSGWQAQEAVTDKDDDQYYPSIAVDSQDNIHIVWEGWGWGTNTGNANTQYRKRTSSGWQTQEAVTDVNYNQFDQTIAIDSQDNVHVIWTGKGWGSNPDYYNVQYRKRTPSGWQTQEGLTDAAITQQYPSPIWALHPTISGAKTNRPKSGYAFVWMDGTTVKFYKSDDLSWDSKVVKVVSETALLDKNYRPSLIAEDADKCGIVRRLKARNGALLVTPVSEEYVAYDKEVITVGSTAVGFSPDKIKNCKVAYCTLDPDAGAIRYWVDGSTPTSTEGHYVDSGQSITITSPTEISNFKAIRVGSTDGKLHVTYKGKV